MRVGCVREVLEVMRCVLLCVREAVEGEFCLLEEQEVMRCELLCILEAVEGGLCVLEVLEVPGVLEAMRCVLLCVLETVEDELCLLEELEVMRCVLLCILEAVEMGFVYRMSSRSEVLEVPEVICCLLLCKLEAVEGGRCLLEVLEGGAGGHALCAAFYARGCGGWAQFRSFEISKFPLSQFSRHSPPPMADS